MGTDCTYTDGIHYCCDGHLLAQQVPASNHMLVNVHVVLYAGVPTSLFGFEGAQLVGKPLSAAIDVFTDWQQGHGEELSLLELLVAQHVASAADGTAAASTEACSSWRVGVHRPEATGHDSSSVGGCVAIALTYLTSSLIRLTEF